jgi:AraC-like DNA-binding protein
MAAAPAARPRLLAGRTRAGTGQRDFPYPQPAHVDDYALIFTEHSSFDAEQLVATFNANLLDLPIRRDEAALTAFLDGAPGKITTLYRRDREMVIRVRDLLRAALPDSLSLEEVADQLHLSPRTIHRRLEEEGSSFRAHQGCAAPRHGTFPPDQDARHDRPGRRRSWLCRHLGFLPRFCRMDRHGAGALPAPLEQQNLSRSTASLPAMKNGDSIRHSVAAGCPACPPRSNPAK